MENIWRGTDFVIIAGEHDGILRETPPRVTSYIRIAQVQDLGMMGGHFREISRGADLRVVSWNLLRRMGAGVEDVARLVKASSRSSVPAGSHRRGDSACPPWSAGIFSAIPWTGAFMGLPPGARMPFPPTTALRLPASVLPGRVPPRHAQMVQFRRHQLCQCASVAWPVPQPLAAFAYRQRPGWPRRHHRRFQCGGPDGAGRLSRYRPAPAHPSGQQYRQSQAGPLPGARHSALPGRRCWTGAHPTIIRLCWTWRWRPNKFEGGALLAF